MAETSLEVLATRRGFEPPSGSAELSATPVNHSSKEAQGIQTPERIPSVLAQGLKPRARQVLAS